jgi:lipid II:glycine glycyltransferase (peptidoglycan interpeptide bridge formation enzyme)
VDVRPVGLTALDASDELLQSGFWGHFKQAHGWRAHAFEVRVDAETRFGLLVLTRSLARLFTIAYVPFGPTHDPATGRAAFLSGLARALRGWLPRNTLFVRYDLPWRRAAPGQADEPPCGGRRPRLVKSVADMQPAHTVVVDLAPPLETVLGSMKPKTRYNIRLAAKKGVSVREGGVGDLDRWYALYEETSRRDRIAIHARRYYEGLLKAPGSYDGACPRVSLLFAWHEGDLLAGNIVVFWRRQAVYLYGASSGVKRNLMPAYALQWEAMRLAREAGCTGYDFFGVPPEPDPGHPMYGLYQFKTGFNDAVTERWGTWDALFRPALYAGYRAAEALRMFYYRNVKKRRRARSRGNE